MMKLATKQLVRVLVFIVVTSFFIKNFVYAKLIIGGVSHAIYSGSRDDEIRDPLTVVACKELSLSVGQIKSIFQISNNYVNNSSMMNHYYWLPCDIKGWLIYNDVMIYFSINAAATAYWYDIVKRERIYFGCNAIECEEYFLLPYNGMGDK